MTIGPSSQVLLQRAADLSQARASYDEALIAYAIEVDAVLAHLLAANESLARLAVTPGGQSEFRLTPAALASLSAPQAAPAKPTRRGKASEDCLDDVKTILGKADGRINGAEVGRRLTLAGLRWGRTTLDATLCEAREAGRLDYDAAAGGYTLPKNLAGGSSEDDEDGDVMAFRA